MHFTLGNTIVKATKETSKRILEKLCPIYTVSVEQCHVMSYHNQNLLFFLNELTKLKRLTQNKNQVQAILIKWFQILLSREDA